MKLQSQFCGANAQITKKYGGGKMNFFDEDDDDDYDYDDDDDE